MNATLKSAAKLLSPSYQKVFLEYKVDMKPRWGHGAKAHDKLYEIIDANRADYAARLAHFASFRDVYTSIRTAAAEPSDQEPGWNNGFLPGLDVIALYGLMAQWKPRRYLEVGSGNSTKVARKAIREQQLATRIVSIDPAPRAAIDALSDQVIRQPVEALADHSVFEQLEPNDILFIDNSHRCFPNSDVTVCFLEIVPRLASGVVVHVHDVYLPYDYPQFMCDRAYSEQYVLAAMLLANPEKYQVVCPNYFISEDPELRTILDPVWNHPNLSGVERHGGSFWIVVR